MAEEPVPLYVVQNVSVSVLEAYYRRPHAVLSRLVLERGAGDGASLPNNVHIKPDHLSVGVVAVVEIRRRGIEETLDEQDVVEAAVETQYAISYQGCLSDFSLFFH